MRNVRRAAYHAGKLVNQASTALSSGRRERRLRFGLIGACALALGAAYVAYRARKAERDHPPAGRFLEVDGVKLHYFERGEGSPVVLLHGNGAIATDFEGSGLIDKLAARHRVIAFDRPGFGFSERPRKRIWSPRAQAALLARALAQLEVQPAVVVGPPGARWWRSTLRGTTLNAHAASCLYPGITFQPCAPTLSCSRLLRSHCSAMSCATRFRPCSAD